MYLFKVIQSTLFNEKLPKSRKSDPCCMGVAFSSLCVRDDIVIRKGLWSDNSLSWCEKCFFIWLSIVVFKIMSGLLQRTISNWS